MAVFHSSIEREHRKKVRKALKVLKVKVSFFPLLNFASFFFFPLENNKIRQLLGNTPDCSSEVNGTLTFRRRRQDNLRSPSISNREESLTNGNDDGEIMESIVKSGNESF